MRSSPAGTEGRQPFRLVRGQFILGAGDSGSASEAHDGIGADKLLGRSHRSANNDPFTDFQLVLEARRKFACLPASRHG